MTFKSLAELLRECEWSDENLRRIAISNLSRGERRLIRWWCNKYKTPEKPLMQHTLEEIAIEMYEDYYEARPEEARQFMAALEVEDWDGTMSPEYEAQIQKRLEKINKRNKVDLSKYQNLDEEITPEQEEMILSSLGRNLPKSRATKPKESDLEFSDEFLGSDS